MSDALLFPESFGANMEPVRSSTLFLMELESRRPPETTRKVAPIPIAAKRRKLRLDLVAGLPGRFILH
jgi:hypothetical protein